MAFWNKKEADFEDMAALIEQQPGISASDLARRREVPTSTGTPRLPRMDEAGILVTEADQGGLWPFGKRR